MNLPRRWGHDTVPTKDEASRTRRVRARRNLAGLEPLEERQLLASRAYMLIGDGTVVHGGATDPAAPKGSFVASIFSWVDPHPPALGVNPNAGTGGPAVTNFIITKAVDAASGALLSALKSGRTFKRAEVLIVKTGAGAKVVEYDFTKVGVKSSELSHSPSPDGPDESDTFSFSIVQVKTRSLTLRGTTSR